MNNIFKKLFVLASLGFFSMLSHAEYPKTEADFALLPPYCKVRLYKADNKSAEYKRWERRMGVKTFVHVHHYCAALFSMNLAITDSGRRSYLLKVALSNVNYIAGRAPKTSRLLPEILTTKGKILIKQGRQPEAVAEFQSAINLNKKYIPAYMNLFDYYYSIEKYDMASEIIETGLKVSPKSKALNRRQDKVNDKIQ